MHTATDLTTRYEQALNAFGNLLANVQTEQLSAPTPCPEWDVRALVDHLAWMNEFVAFGAPQDHDPDREPTVDDLRQRFEASADGLRATLLAPGAAEKTFQMPWGDVTGQQLMTLSLLEHVIHGWDLAHSTGQTVSLDPELYSVALDLAQVAMGHVTRGPGHNLGHEVQVAADAPPSDRLAAFYGRQP